MKRNTKIIILTSLVIVIFLLYDFAKSTEKRILRIYQQDHITHLWQKVKMYCTDNKSEYIPNHINFKTLIGPTWNNDAEYHYNPEKTLDELISKKQKILSHDGITLYSDGSITDSKQKVSQ